MKTREWLKGILASLMLMLSVDASAGYFEVDGIWYEYDSESSTTVRVINNNSYYSYSGAITIPSSVTYNSKTYSVTEIGEYAFDSCIGLTSIDIPNSVTSIGLGAFYYCTGLTFIDIPNGVTSIGLGAFDSCTGLTTIDIPNSVTVIEEYAFSGCIGLTSIKVESGNTVYDSREDCNAIIETSTNTLITGCKNTKIPNGVTKIESDAFHGCTGLTSIEIPNSVTKIESGAFSGCASVASIKVESGNTVYDSREDCNAIIETSTNTLITGCKSTKIPNTVTEIGNHAFDGCRDLTSIEIPNSVTKIRGGAFSGCTGLTSIEIPNSVTEIKGGAFSGCTGLTTIAIPNGVTKIANNIFDGCTSLTTIAIPNGVTEIGERAFYDCTSLTTIAIPNGVTKIEECAFYNCTSLTSIDIPNGVTKIGNNAFYGCTSLTTVAIPNGVTKIEEFAFYNCTSLTSIEIPNSVTAIGERAFWGCAGLASIDIPSSVTVIEEYAFFGCANVASIKVESDNTVYDSREDCNAIIETSTNTLITGCKNTKIPNSVTAIGGDAFYGCTGLTSIEIPNSVTVIEEYAFSDCTGLTIIDIPNSVTAIGRGAFYNCTSLSSIKVESDNTVYDSREDCNAIIETSTNTLIAGCKSTKILNSVTAIGRGAFHGCTGLTTVSIPNSVTAIDLYAFWGCTGLTTIVIPNSVTRIGNYAFAECTSLMDIYSPNPEPCTLEADAFYNCSASLHVPTGSVAAYQAAEGWKKFQNIVEQEYTLSVTLVSLGEGQPNVATFSAPFATAIPDGVKAYAITDTEGEYATISVIEGDVIPANTGVLLASSETAASMAYTSARGTAPAGNKLVATGGAAVAVTPAAGMKAFILANSSKGVGFYPLSTTNNTVPAYRAYLELPDGIASVRINFGDTTTGIDAAEVATDTNAPIFDLSGRRVAKPGKPGMYVKGGVKFIVK